MWQQRSFRQELSLHQSRLQSLEEEGPHSKCVPIEGRTAKFCGNEIGRKNDQPQMCVPVSMNECQTKMLVDTGADISTIGVNVWEKLGRSKLTNYPKKCVGVDKRDIEKLGSFKSNVEFNERQTSARILVVPIERCALLGRTLLLELDIVKLNMISDTQILSLQCMFLVLNFVPRLDKYNCGPDP